MIIFHKAGEADQARIAASTTSPVPLPSKAVPRKETGGKATADKSKLAVSASGER